MPPDAPPVESVEPVAKPVEPEWSRRVEHRGAWRDDTACSVCGRSPAVLLHLRRHMGLIILMRFKKLQAPFCRVHGEAVAKEFLRRTLVEGWWGYLSFFLNWAAIAADMKALRQVRKLAPPVGEVDPAFVRELPDEIRTAATESEEDRAARRSVGWTAAAAIGVGALGLVLATFKHNEMDTAAHRVGFAAALTMLVYMVVAFVVYARTSRLAFRPRIVEGDVAAAVGIGAIVGGGCALVLGGIMSALSGHVTSDPRIVGVLAEGNVLAIGAIVFIACMAAPLLEEFLFRGLLVESLRTKGRTSAILGGAVAFSLWHLSPSSLRYYVLMGFLFGYLYWRLGLAGSISAHAAFNGVLTIFAFVAVSSTAVVTGPSGVQATLPGGWRVAHVKSLLPVDLAAESAGGAGLIIQHLDLPFGNVASAKLPSLPPGATSLGPRVVAGGNALGFKTSKDGHEIDVFLVPRGRRGYSVTFVPEHAEKATQQLDSILKSLLLPPL